jgi:hypothetical protein
MAQVGAAAMLTTAVGESFEKWFAARLLSVCSSGSSPRRFVSACRSLSLSLPHTLTAVLTSDEMEMQR